MNAVRDTRIATATTQNHFYPYHFARCDVNGVMLMLEEITNFVID